MRTPLCDSFGIDVPIFAFSHCRDVVVAVSQAGGFGVLKEIRAGSANMATPVMIVSVLDDMETNDRCIAAGANGYLVKPVERRALAYAVKALLAARGKAQK